MRYRTPESWIKILFSYYDGLRGRKYGDFAKIEWTKYEKGIFAEYKVSVILFLLAFKIIIEYVQAGKPKQYALQGNAVEVARGFMDDLSLALPPIPTALFSLRRTIDVLEWDRMRLKPSKSKSAVFYRGLIEPVEPSSVSCTIIPGLQVNDCLPYHFVVI